MNRPTPLLRQILVPVALALLIAGCATAPQPPAEQTPEASQPGFTPDAALVARAEMADAQGNVVIAAQEYQALAQGSPSPWREDFWLKAASALARGGYTEEAQRITAELARQPLTPQQQIDLRLIEARIALMASDAEQALEILSFAPAPDLATETRVEYHRLRAEAFDTLGNYLESVRQRIALDALLTDPEQKRQNHQRLWQSLNRLTPDALQAFITEPPPDILSGWLELAFYIKSTIADPTQMEAQLELWRSRYPDHPAAGDFLDNLIANKDELVGRPEQIALLLPLSGNFAAPATAVRDGFLAAYYARQDSDYQPDIRIYDTQGDPQLGQQLYQQAIEEGADFVVGPLTKSLVEQLLEAEEITTPTLALNYGQSDNVHPQLYQFGLRPEDEARQVAERAWLDGYNNALVLIPEGEWGERLGNTFNQHWEQLSGVVLETQRYNPGKNDFSTPVQRLLNIDESKARFGKLERLLGGDIKFEPRRRQDVDFIFSAAFPRQARQIRPQLKFFYAADLPVYSTSHTYAGVEDPTHDRDMDGILFCDMPWVLTPETVTQPRWSDIEREWQNTAHAFKRLYAMGADAYRLIPWLRYLRSHRQDHFSGATGNLYLDNSNRIHRQLIWARFRGGKPVLDSDNDRYAQPF